MIYYIVGSMLFAAAVTDILWRKIPNIIIFIYFTIGMAVLSFDFFIRFLVSLFLFSILYNLRFFGAGDIKIFALVIGFLGTYEGVNLTVTALVLAGIGSLLYMLCSNQLGERINKLKDYCIRVAASGRLLRYHEYNLKDKYLIPISPYFLAGFILWRCFC